MLSSITAAAAASLIAIVTQDQAALRAAPRDSAQQQVLMWQGDSVEIRGERLDYLQVYDHRRERAGFIKASQVRLVRIASIGHRERRQGSVPGPVDALVGFFKVQPVLERGGHLLAQVHEVVAGEL